MKECALKSCRFSVHKKGEFMNFNEVLSYIQKIAKQYIYKFPSTSMYSLEDLVNEGVLKYYETVDKYDDQNKATFKTYLSRVLVNKYNTLLRKEITRHQTYKKRFCEKLYETSDFEIEFSNDVSDITKRVVDFIHDNEIPTNLGYLQRREYIQKNLGISSIEMEKCVKELEKEEFTTDF